MENGSPNSDVAKLSAELDQMRSMAMGLMRSNSDLGVISQFLKTAFTIDDYCELAQALIKCIAEEGVTACVLLETYTGSLFQGDVQKWQPDIEQRVSEAKLTGRIIDDGETVQFNFDKISLRVKDLPDDQDRVGQLKDNLMILLDGAQGRIIGLIAEEKASEARKSKEEFFALMSHELRTPLNPIIGFSKRLEARIGEDISEKYAGPIRTIRMSAEGLSQLINHIIEIGNFEAGEVAVNPICFNVNDALDRVMVNAEDYAEKEGIKLVKDIPENTYYIADPPRFIDILYGLVTYSIKHCAKSKITISVEKVNMDSSGESLHVKISDDGTQLSEGSKARLFDHLLAREVSSVNESNNLGIGLYLTKKLVDLHNGKISIGQAAGGNGNEFSLYFPPKVISLPQ